MSCCQIKSSSQIPGPRPLSTTAASLGNGIAHDKSSPTTPEHTFEVVLSPDWPTDSPINPFHLKLAVKFVNKLLKDSSSFNRVYLPVCMKFSTANIYIEPNKFYDTCMVHDKVPIRSISSFNILNNFDGDRTLMLVDSDKRDTIIVNDQAFRGLGAVIDTAFVLAVSMLHEIAHILTPTFNEIVERATKGTPDHIGVVNYGEGIVQPDCGFEMERNLFGGFVMFRQDGTLIFYQIKDQKESIDKVGNVVKRPINAYLVGDFLADFQDYTEFPIEELVKLVSDEALGQELMEITSEEVEEIASRKSRINFMACEPQPIKYYPEESFADLLKRNVKVRNVTEKR